MYWKIRRKILDSWRNFRRACQRFKRGYAWVDVWDYFDWFITMSEPMIRHLQENHCGHPFEYTDEEWTQRLKEMADCLHYMDEQNVIDELYGGDYMKAKEVSATMEENRKKFFELFSKDFYHLWD